MTSLDYPLPGVVRYGARLVDEVPSPSPVGGGTATHFVVLVTGSRYADDSHRNIIASVLADMLSPGHHPKATLRHGAAPGVDTIAADLVTEWGWSIDPYPANWADCGEDCPPRPHRKMGPYNAYCPLAGPRRNRAMVDALPRPDVVVAFPDIDATPSKSGTMQCLLYAIRQGLHIGSVDGLAVTRRYR